MTEAETRVLLFKASAAYPNQVEISDEMLSVWIEHMQDIEVTRAVDNLNSHIATNKFFPTVSDILRVDDVQNNYDQLRIETQERLSKLRLMESNPAITPERLEEIRRQVRNGDFDERFKNDPYLGKR